MPFPAAYPCAGKRLLLNKAMKTNRLLTFCLGLLAAGLGATHATAANPDRPNVIFFLMDDLGWNDLGYTGSKFYESPNIDRLAAQGVKFSRAYAANICSPTRASLLTGLDPGRIGLTTPQGGDKREVLKAEVQPRAYSAEELKTGGLSLPGFMGAPPNQRALQVISVTRLSTDHPSIGKIFKANGYTTAHFGKWHVGPEPFSPLQHGFDVDVPHINIPGPMPPGHFGPWRDWPGEDGPESKGKQIDDRLAEYAIKFIRENKDRPFYMNFWTYGVHIPFQAKKELVDYFKTKADPASGQRNPLYAAMVKHTDDAIGRVWQAVEEAGLAHKTVVVFLSDNGGINWGMSGFNKAYDMEGGIPVTDNSPYRGGKGSVYEGGVRVPGFVIWPSVAKAGSQCDLPINTRDIFPTLAEICSLENLPKFDGRSVAPALKGQTMEERPIFSHYPHYGAWAKGNAPVTTVSYQGWKLLRFYFDGPDQSHRCELYHLEEDPGESIDYSRTAPERLAKLEKLMDEYLKQIGAVLPKPNPEYIGAIKGSFEGISYELLEPMKRGVKAPLVICMEGEGNPAYAHLQRSDLQIKDALYLLKLKSPATAAEMEDLAQKLPALIEQLAREHPIVAWRVFMTGKGEGADAAWNLAARQPRLFGAIVPIGGAGAPDKASALKGMPVQAFAAASQSSGVRQTVEALKTAGSTVANYTEYDRRAPEMLNQVWRNPEVLAWLLAQKRPSPDPKSP